MKIQLKRSNQLVSGSAKEPSIEHMEYGELAVNYNEADPAIFLKDSSDNIIRISGVGNISDDGIANVPAGPNPPSDPEAGNLWFNPEDGRLYIYYVETSDGGSSQWVDASPDSWNPEVIPDVDNPASQPDTLDDRYVNKTGDRMSGQLELPGGGDSLEALQKQEVEALITTSENTADGLYLRKDVPDTAVGPISFTGQTTHAGGVQVTGSGSVTDGIIYSNDRYLEIRAASQVFVNCDTLNNNLGFFGGASAGVKVGGSSRDKRIGFQFNNPITTNGATAGGSTLDLGFHAIKGTTQFADDGSTEAEHVSCFYACSSNNQDGPLVKNQYGFAAGSRLRHGFNNYGFYTDLYVGNHQGGAAYGFYSFGDAPNFFKGDTHIGGTTARNTFDLWKSTLTEEQQEQYEAGTYAVPANVSLPGDGSFARQWWYNQQSAEDQALIDSGELGYPTQFAAATFTDTFDLGDNTKIKLDGGTGQGTFSGGVKVTGGSAAVVDTGISTNGYTNELFAIAGGTSVAQFASNGSTVLGVDGISQSAHALDIRQNGTFTNDSLKQGESSLIYYVNKTTNGDTRATAAFGIVAEANADSNKTPVKWSFQANRFGAGLDEIAYIDSKGGFYNNVGSDYSIYASGSAPNYFAGRCICGTPSINNISNVVSPNSVMFGVSNSSGNNGAIELLGINNAASRVVQIFTTTSGSGPGQTPTVAGDITILAGGIGVNFNESSDYRIKSNIQLLPSAIETVKALKPSTFEINGYSRQGFIAHELQELVPQAVTGAKDATEPIGTVVDYDGTELETNVTEPDELTYEEQVEATPAVAAVAATYDEYGNELTPAVDEVEATYTTVTRTKTWTPTGTQPVYQGVDQTKLIPLLTKALQEALERIETLEAQVNS